MKPSAKIHPSQWRLVLVSRQWSARELATLAAMMALDCERLGRLCGERITGHWTVADIGRTAMRSEPSLPVNLPPDA